MRYRDHLAALCVALAFGLFVPACGSATLTWNTLTNPINPGQLTGLPFGELSYWLQPWRSSLVTQPATELENAIGINIDNQISQAEIPATARLLGQSGFRRARLEINWDQMSYANPSMLANPYRWTVFLTALRNNGLRPLILLNANPGGPTPMPSTNMTLNLTASAAQGARTIVLDSASAAQVVPGLTGINIGGVAAQVLITSVGLLNIATLSQPLPAALPAGPVAASTLLYPPFAPPVLANGSPNPRFQQTLAGWLSYVKAVCKFVAGVYGSDNFDVEVWNEDQTFLNEANYFNPVPDPGSTGSAADALLQATIQMLHDPTNGLTDIKIGDGFTDKTPFPSGATVPAGLDAIDKHPYAPDVSVSPSNPTEPGIQPVDINAQPARAASGIVQPIFSPTFRAFFPEFWLSGVQTETLMRDLSPMTTIVQGVQHGASTHPAGSAPPAMWITEDNLDATQAEGNGLPAADLPEMQAKAALRFYTAFASEGVPAIDLFASKGGACCQLISQSFFNAVDAAPTSYPASKSGPTTQAVERMVSTLAGAVPIAQPRQLTLSSIAQYGNNSQFSGNGTASYPDLYDRNVLAFFPFQVSQNSFVASVYVMTRDLTHEYTSTPTGGQSAYDLPPEAFQLAIGGVNSASASVALYDPLTGLGDPAAIIARSPGQIVVQLLATDSPRMLIINDGAQAAAIPKPQVVKLTWKVPGKVAAASALKSGIKVSLGCGAACSFLVSATPSKAPKAPVYGTAAAYSAASKVVSVTLKMNSKGRAWLRKTKSTRLRITVRYSVGSVKSGIVKITRPPARKR